MQTSKLNLTLARLVFVSTALICFVGVLLELWYAYHHTSSLPPNAGFTRTFGPGLDSLLNQFVFFTTQSNLILGVTTLLLAFNLDRTSSSFHVWRLIGIINITITGIVFNFVLQTVPKNNIIADTASTLEHNIAPILAVLGWIIFGPAKTVTLRRILLAAILPIGYATFTLIRGAIQEWYPYNIMDVPRLGYSGVMINIIGIFVLFLLIAGFLALVDKLLSSKFGRISFPNT
ncbi:Pr6Pr family membrane protein [Leptospira andrefontaineae]|uniref:F420-dependent oxidoreductase n=1 Tax=Leptospira andrefontaineae TaxID=2484976 RepID=A0A4R9HBA8_9LEPT|nr:Pr6Pr family membrane protein [Leptospira andrefontaineae]TGK43843.1 hypothetical protein EHO65_04190 [Leptospira andrefontaineae]